MTQSGETVSRVYVDQFPPGWGRWSGGGHMLASDLGALHAMAKRIGLKREWFQDKTFAHYDVMASKRKLAVAAGAIEIEFFEEVPDDVLMSNRDGTYETHGERMARARAAR